MGKRRPTVLICLPLLLLLLASCSDSAATTEPAPTILPTAVLAPEVLEAIETLEPVLTAVPQSSTAEEDSTGVVQTRAPEPTATPGPITAEVERLFGQPDSPTFLRLETADWANLIISLLLVVAAYVIATWLIFRMLARVVHRTQSELDDLLFKAIRSSLRWEKPSWLET